jgi:hypothetical protein
MSSMNTVCRYKYVIDFVKTGIKLSLLRTVILSRAIMEMLRNQRDLFSARLPTQVVTYPRRCFRQTI